MRRRVFGFMSLNILLTSVLFAVFAGITIGIQFSKQIKTSLKTERITLISETGEVLFDNYTDSDTLDNHLNRPEVIDAVNNGYGESERFSDTLFSKTYYYAMKLTDNSILRLSVKSVEIYSMMGKFLPALAINALLVLLISFLAARSLTNKIIDPINKIDLNAAEIDTYDELTPFIREILRQKQKINEQMTSLETRSSTIEAIAGNMKEGLILTDPNGEILSSNLSVAEIFSESNMAGRNILEICRHMDLLQKVKSCLLGENMEMAFKINGKTYSVYLNPVYDNNRVSGAMILFLDITEKLKAEKHRKEFSANVSHELRTPLTTISALSEMIGNGMAKEEDIQEFIGKISNQSKRLISIVDDVIKLSEFDEGNTVREYTSFDLYELTCFVTSALVNKAREKNVTIGITGERMLITANERMIDELLFNLIDNSIKYNKDGGSLTVSLEKADDYRKISVSDTGIGIPAKHLGRVFERFYTVDKSRSKKTGGTGLGLSIVKHIVEHHNGKIEIESRENFGTTIVCYISNSDLF